MRRNSHRDAKPSKRPDDPLDELQNETLASPKPTPPIRHGFPTPQSLRGLEDRRKWDPGRPSEVSPRQPARDFSGRNARISQQPKKSSVVRRGPGGKPLQSRQSYWLPEKTALPRFHEARKTIICLKRRMRREVMFAFKKTKKGSGSPKKRNEYTEVHCD